jgi:hypothetical protein
MTVKITTANGGSDSLDFGCAQTAIVATVTGTEVSSGEGKLELKTTTGGTSAAKLTIAANGTVTLAAPLPVASGGTGSTTGSVYLQTAQATTSGTVKDFTSIPAGVNRITVSYLSVSSAATSNYIIQLGAGGIVTSGYVSNLCHVAPSISEAQITTGFAVGKEVGSGGNISGVATCIRHTGNTWMYTANTAENADTQNHFGAGSVALSAAVDTVRFTSAEGDTLDAGSVNISWEF